jgi:hypothetical protein
MKRTTRREVLVGGVAAGMTALASTPQRTARAEASAAGAQAGTGAAVQPAPLERRVLDAIDPDEVLGFVQDLVRAPSIFPRERECALLITVAGASQRQTD